MSARSKSVSRMKLRSETASQEFSVTLRKPRDLHQESPVDRDGGSGQGSRTQGKDIHPLERFLQPGLAALERPEKGQDIVREQDALALLKVRVPGHDGAGMRFRQPDQALLDFIHRVQDPGDFLLQVDPFVRRHLFVPAPARVQFLPRLSDLLGEQDLHHRMDVLETVHVLPL